GVAAVAAVAVVAAGCSSTTNSGGGTGTPLKGISGSSVKIGVVIPDSGSLGQSLGFKQVDAGGVDGMTKAINAVIADINGTGGMGGR
ncbi:hypothetical protein, partial [Enterococcus casseliflavus]|uniref:hypothetical protein n=1 Tax=Enterococcus casseliflavus TaxID=37734 RepID=UPI003D1525A7